MLYFYLWLFSFLSTTWRYKQIRALVVALIAAVKAPNKTFSNIVKNVLLLKLQNQKQFLRIARRLS